MHITLSYDDGRVYSTRNIDAAETEQVRAIIDQALESSEGLAQGVVDLLEDIVTLTNVEQRERHDPARRA